MKKIIISLVFLLLIIAFFIGFIEIDNTKEVARGEGIVYSVDKIPNNLSTITNLSKRDEDIICATSKGLVEKDMEGNVAPSLARDMVIKDEGIEYEFTLNDDIYWNDGSKIDVSDISNFFKELIKEEDESNIEAILDIYGAKEFKDGKTTFEKGVAISTEGNIIKIRLNKKNENFMSELTKPQYRIRKNIPLWSNLNKSYKNIVYSGEYYISSVGEGNIQLARNKKYSGSGPEKISILEDENEELAMASFEIGNRDVVLNPPKSQLSRLSNDNKLITFPSNEGKYLAMRGDNENLSAIDRREIYKIIYEATEGFEGENPERIEVAEGSYFREDKEDLTKLQTRKVSINKEEEWKKPEVINLLAKDNDDNRDYCKYLVSWFKDKEGINLRYSLVSEEELKDVELQKRYGVILFNANAYGKERLEFYKNIESILSGDEKKLFNEELIKGDFNFTKIEEELFSNYRILPIMFLNNNVAISDRISSISSDGNGNIDFNGIWK
ncbi:ABC transporter substrate-binding protein [Clostridium paraputrificum]|uniref:ABC transporter substrate-binding protein n=1 Tax=Clostridium TaxID=1485 RepID=UPI003D3558C5